MTEFSIFLGLLLLFMATAVAWSVLREDRNNHSKFEPDEHEDL